MLILDATSTQDKSLQSQVKTYHESQVGSAVLAKFLTAASTSSSVTQDNSLQFHFRTSHELQLGIVILSHAAQQAQAEPSHFITSSELQEPDNHVIDFT